MKKRSNAKRQADYRLRSDTYSVEDKILYYEEQLHHHKSRLLKAKRRLLQLRSKGAL